ncbi:hypothetical protein [Prosthecomicrobium sp. N25]|uniref:hypothetical protein n=1 Tax=Prosthecomicrobium sp. N25 TaxID=3129254 RepID=UPI003076936F
MKPNPPAGTAARSGGVRPFGADDAPAVAALFLRTFRKSATQPSRDLVACFREHFLAPRRADEPSASRVFVDDAGSVSGFVGVLPARFLIDGRPVEVSVAGTLMVDRPEENPLAGARLVRAVSGPDTELTLSETANPISERLWARIGGRAIPGYSLDFLTVLRPAGLAVALAGRALPLARAAALPARALDRFAARLVDDGLAPDPHGSDVDVGPAEAAAHVFALSASRRFRPDWTVEEILHRLQEARTKALFGDFVVRLVRDRRGAPVGLFLYHVRRDGIAQVLNILAHPGREADVVARLVADARARGAVGIKGRAEPAFTHALAARRTVFLHRASLLVHAADATLFEPLAAGDALATGLAVENWIRLIGNALI